MGLGDIICGEVKGMVWSVLALSGMWCVEVYWSDVANLLYHIWPESA